MKPRALALLLLAWPGVAAGAPAASGSLRVSVGSELDTNARREIEQLADEIQTDGLLRVVVDGFGRLELGRQWRLSGQLLAGGKRFFEQSSEDQWAQLTNVELTKTIGRVTFGPAGTFRISRVRRGVRDYALQRGQVRAEANLGAGWVSGAWGGYLAYQFEPEPAFSHAGPGGGLFVRQQLSEAFLWTAWFDGFWRDFDGPILISDDVGGGRRILCDPAVAVRCPDREDSELRWGVQLRYRGPVLAGVSYQLARQRSNSEAPLEDVDRHRISGFATVPLLWDVLLSVQAALQVFDGDSPTGELLLGDEDEDRNNVQVQLRRPLFAQVDLEVRYAYYANQLGGGSDLDLSRHTVFAGVSVRTEGRTVDERANRR